MGRLASFEGLFTRSLNPKTSVLMRVFGFGAKAVLGFRVWGFGI